VARKSAGDEVGSDSTNISDVAEVWDSGEFLSEDFSGIRFDFRKGDGLPPGSLSGQSESRWRRAAHLIRSDAPVIGGILIFEIADALLAKCHQGSCVVMVCREIHKQTKRVLDCDSRISEWPSAT
jgi:hypothetical protein